MAKKENLNRLLDFIGDLLDQEDHEWLIDGLLKKIANKAPVEEIAKHAVIKNIHEYCVEEVIKRQAEKFYEDFRIEELKPQLIQDFIKMEHERRRDDFENFCLHMFQQVENLTNHLFLKKEFIVLLISKRNQVAFLKYDSSRPAEGYRVDQLLFGKKKEDPISELDDDFTKKKMMNWYLGTKFRSVLYFYYFQENLKDLNDFGRIYDVFYELYQVRNKNHRGGKIGIEKNEKLIRIEAGVALYYLKFYGFLADIISTINSHLLETKNPYQIKEDFILVQPGKTVPLDDIA